MAREDIRIIYICKRCLNEDWRSIEINETEEKQYPYPHKCCSFCHSQDFIRASYIFDIQGNYYKHKDYKQIKSLIKSIKKQSTFDSDLYKKRINLKKESEKATVSSIMKTTTNSSISSRPKCPTCGSTNIKDISTLNRAVSVGMFGLASSKIGKTKECKDCGYKW